MKRDSDKYLEKLARGEPLSREEFRYMIESPEGRYELAKLAMVRSLVVDEPNLACFWEELASDEGENDYALAAMDFSLPDFETESQVARTDDTNTSPEATQEDSKDVGSDPPSEKN